MANYLDQYKEYLSQSYKLISDIGLELALSIDNGELNNSTVNELLGYVFFGRNVRDLQATEDQRLDPLTAMVNQAPLLPIPIPLGFFGSVNIFPPSIPPLLSHSQLLNILGPGELHLDDTLLNKLISLPFNYGWDDIVGNNPLINAPLAAIIGGLEPAFAASGNPARYLNGNKAFSQVQFSHLGGVPTTLAGYGISSSDTLFDGRYLRANTVLSTYSLGSNTPINNTLSTVQMFGNVQAQINAREAALGNPSTNGYILSSTTAGVRSWVPFAGGGTLNSVSINSLNGFAGTAVVTTGNAAITLRTSVTGILIGNGTAISAATEMTDYIGITGAADGDTIVYDGTAGVATWAPGLFNPMDTLGDIIYGLALGVTAKLAGNTTTTNKFLRSTGDGTLATAPSWQVLGAGDIPDIAISQVTNLQNTLDGYLPDALANNMIFIGNSISNVAVNAVVAGDLTAVYVINSGVNEAQFTIADAAVTYAKIQDVTSQAILGRFALADGEVQQLNLSTDFVINSSTGEIALASPNPPLLTAKGDILTRTGAATVRLGIGADATFFMADAVATTGNKWVAMSGDATIAVSGALTIANSAVTLAKMANLAANSFIGNNTGSAATPIALTVTQATAMLNLFSTSATTKGLVPGSNSVGATYYLDATGAWSVPAGGGGGGSGTVTSVSVVSANGFAGTVATATTTPAITLTTSITGLLKGSGGALVAATAGTDYLTSIGLAMPSAFNVSTPNPLVANGTFTVTGAGTVAQYIRGDGSLANFPTSGGGGASVSYYLNGSVTQFGTYKQMSKVPVIGGGTDFPITGTSGLIAQFVTDVNDPSLLNIPAGAWDMLFYFSASNNTGNPSFYVELWVYDGTNFTLVASNSANPEIINNGTVTDLYTTSLAIPTTTLAVTDRLVIRVYGDTNGGGRTITLHTENSNLSQVITTFSTGLTALNGLTAQVQSFANGSTGTAPAFVSSTATHTLNIPLASAASVTAGLISNTEFNTFNDKMSNPMTAEGDIIYGGTVTGGVADPTALPRGSDGKFLTLSGGVPAWGTVPSMVYPAAGIANSTGTSWGTSYTTTGSGTVLALDTSPTLVTPIVTGVATFGNGASAGEIRLLEGSGSGSNFVALKSPATLGADLSLTFPNTTPGSGQTLVSDGSGVLSWSSNPGTTNSIYRRAYGGTVVNTTPETLLQSLLVPANTFTDGVGWQVMATTSRTNPGSNAVTFKLYINTTATIGGVALAGTGYVNAAAAGTSSFHFCRLGFVQIASGGSRITVFVPSTASTNYALPGGTLLSSAIDWSVDQYFILTVAQTSAVSTVTCNSMQLIPQ